MGSGVEVRAQIRPVDWRPISHVPRGAIRTPSVYRTPDNRIGITTALSEPDFVRRAEVSQVVDPETAWLTDDVFAVMWKDPIRPSKPDGTKTYPRDFQYLLIHPDGRGEAIVLEPVGEVNNEEARTELVEILKQGIVLFQAEYPGNPSARHIADVIGRIM